MPNNPAQRIDPHPSGLTRDQIEDYEANFSIWQPLVNVCCVVTALLFLFGTHFLLAYASHALTDSDRVSGLHIQYQQTIWWYFPGCGAVCLCFEIVLQIWSIFLGRKIVNLYAEWAARQPKRSRGGITYYDSRKLYRWLTLLLALPFGIGTALALDMHTTFAEDGMHEYGYAFATPEIYSYSQIRQVIQVDGVLGKHDAFIRRPYVAIDFADGHRWSQHKWDDTTPGVTYALHAMLQAHTDLPFLHARVL